MALHLETVTSNFVSKICPITSTWILNIKEISLQLILYGMCHTAIKDGY